MQQLQGKKSEGGRISREIAIKEKQVLEKVIQVLNNTMLAFSG